jgi:hypothetical protein
MLISNHRKRRCLIEPRLSRPRAGPLTAQMLPLTIEGVGNPQVLLEFFAPPEQIGTLLFSASRRSSTAASRPASQF